MTIIDALIKIWKFSLYWIIVTSLFIVGWVPPINDWFGLLIHNHYPEKVWTPEGGTEIMALGSFLIICTITLSKYKK